MGIIVVASWGPEDAMGGTAGNMVPETGVIATMVTKKCVLSNSKCEIQ